MKILHFVHNYYGFSGASRQAKNIAEGISVTNHKIEQRFFSIGEKNSDYNSKFIIYTTPRTLLKRCLIYISIILKYKPDIIHMHGADFAILFLSKILGVKIYWKSTLCGSDDFRSLISGKNSYIKRKLISLIDCNNTLTRQMFDINCDFLDENKLVTIPNGVDIPLDNNFKKEKIALIVSAIIPRKGVIEGIKFFNEKLMDDGYILYIIGPKDKTLDGYNDTYINDFYKLLNGNIKYFGKLEFNEIKVFLSKALYLIHFSESEGMPNVVLEAMAYNIYPILKDMGGLTKELINNNITGFNIDDVLYDINLIDPLGNIPGRQRVIEYNSFDTITKKTLMTYERLIR